ncbi:MAG: hypothetical protein IKO47_08625 [Ruminococcus sp.]|nr:hypothetical protein [Ruminococcus sp.]
MDNYNADAELSILEEFAVALIKDEFIKRNINFDCIRFRRRSKDYLTLLAPNDFDFCRIKTTERVTWFTIHGLNLPKQIQNDERFNDTKKNLVHWKVRLDNVGDFETNSDLIAESFVSIHDL